MSEELIREILQKLKNFWNLYENSSKNKAVDLLEYELGEMENIFGLLVLGNFLGLPSPPINISLDLIPDMERHLVILFNKIDTSENPLSELVSTLNIT